MGGRKNIDFFIMVTLPQNLIFKGEGLGSCSILVRVRVGLGHGLKEEWKGGVEKSWAATSPLAAVPSSLPP